VIAGGAVVSSVGSVRADVLVADGVIAAIGEVDRSGATVYDAEGCLVIPGAIDVHTHVFGRIEQDTRSALCGGTTSALAFVDALPGESPAEAAHRTLAEEMPNSRIDLAFHSVIWEPRAYKPGDLRDVAALGTGSVKLWLAYLADGIMADDDVAFRVMQEAAELGMVTLAHCENGRIIDVLTKDFVARGELGLGSLPASRPIQLEAECIRRFLTMAELTNASAYVVHVTGREPIEEIARARDRGVDVHGEVCAHHLLFDESDHSGPDGLRYVMTPPLRSAVDRDALWTALRDGALSTYASDHCHLRLDPDKALHQDDFTKVPPGLPGIAARLPIAFAFGVGKGKLSVERLVAVACEAPARIFGLYPKKGVIAPGADGDIVVWDPATPIRLTAATVADGLDWTPYEGIEIPGTIRYVLAGGDLVVQDGGWLGSDRRGTYLSVERVHERVTA
jgi:dihydropyrimidinase